MSKAALAVYNDSLDYINLFLAFFRGNNTMFDVCAFTSLDLLHKHLEDSATDILLLSKDSLTRCDYNAKNGNKEDLHFSNVKEIVYLGEQQKISGSPKELNMYRPMREILDDLTLIARDMHLSEDTYSANAGVIGVYVLDGQYDPGAFALSLAKNSFPSDCLYLDLDRFSALQSQYSFAAGHNLSDLIYYYRTGSELFDRELKSCTAAVDRVPVISAPVSADDLDEIPPSKWGSFLQKIAASGGYSTIIVSVTDSCKDLVSLFTVCSRIYLLSDEFLTAVRGQAAGQEPQTMSRSFHRAKAFHEYFLSMGQEELLAKMTDGRSISAAPAKTPAASSHKGTANISHKRR